MSVTTFRSRRTTVLVSAAFLAAALVGCSSEDTEPKAQDSVSTESSDDESSDAEETEEPEETDDADEAEDAGTVSEDALAEAVAGAMDEETGTTFPVECDGGIDGIVGAEQRCWRIITGLEDQGVPDDSRLGIDVTVDYLNPDGPHLDMQADDAISPPED
ncbi:hypothetical protein [Sanguibacter sp. 25GB23B1]|uniref:hypothetical protein n=1 Tax=unclassified Sanguibacter TaxID=2645534 RepID=UPI0032AFFA5F